MPKLAYKQILKWVGGKSGSVARIGLALPPRIPLYYEPFFGGGSVYWAHNARIERAILGDYQADLIELYSAVREDWRRVYDLCLGLDPSKEAFLRMRAYQPKDRWEHAAKWIYINRNCFNGIMRKNADGDWTATWGQGAANRYPQDFAERLEVCAGQLQKAALVAGDFSQLRPSAGWVCYFDPPYPQDPRALSGRTSFTGYTGQGFDMSAHERLRAYAGAWAQAGSFVLVSNLDTPAIRALYAGCPMVSMPVGRRCAGKSVRDDGQASITRAQELLIRVVS